MLNIKWYFKMLFNSSHSNIVYFYSAKICKPLHTSSVCLAWFPKRVWYLNFKNPSSIELTSKLIDVDLKPQNTNFVFMGSLKCLKREKWKGSSAFQMVMNGLEPKHRCGRRTALGIAGAVNLSPYLLQRLRISDGYGQSHASSTWSQRNRVGVDSGETDERLG